MNQGIKKIVVVDEDGDTWEYEGFGHMTVVNTIVPGKTIAENRPVRYVTLTLNLSTE